MNYYCTAVYRTVLRNGTRVAPLNLSANAANDRFAHDSTASAANTEPVFVVC